MAAPRTSTTVDPLPFDPFRPPPLLGNRHVQTVAGRVARVTATCRYRRETLPTPDGDRLHLDWAVAGERAPGPGASGAPTVVVLHGLEGSSASGYVRETCSRALRAGLQAVVLNFRSCGGEPNLRLRSYHSGETGDFALVLSALRARAGSGTLAAVGYSLGGNVLLRHLEETGDRSPLRAAVAVSSPYDLSSCATALERGPGRMYAAWFLRSLRAKAREKARRFPGAFDLEQALRARTLREFDEAVTAPVHGFASAADYYARSSAGPLLGRIRVPTLLIQAEDDPFVPPDALAPALATRNPRIERAISRHGGHLGFLGVPGRGPALWAEPAAIAWISDRAWHPDQGRAYIRENPQKRRFTP